MTRDELIALAESYSDIEHDDYGNRKLVFDDSCIIAFAAALSSATPAGEGLTLPKSYASSTVTSTLYGHAHVSFHFDDPQEAEAWHDQVISSHALAASPVPMSDTGAQEVAVPSDEIERKFQSSGMQSGTARIAFYKGFRAALVSPPPQSTGEREGNWYEKNMPEEWKKITSPQTQSVPEDMVQRMKDAIEGECDGLAIDDEHAKAILEYVLASPPPQSAPQDAQPFESMEQAYDQGFVDGQHSAELQAPQSAPQDAQPTDHPRYWKERAYEAERRLAAYKAVNDGLAALSAPQESQSTPGEAVATYNGQDADATAELLACLDGLNHGTNLYTHPATTHSAPVAGMTEPVPIGELVALRRNAKRYKVLRDGRHGFNAYRLAPKTGKRWRGYGDEGDILKGDELDKQVDNAIEAALRKKAGGKA